MQARDTQDALSAKVQDTREDMNILLSMNTNPHHPDLAEWLSHAVHTSCYQFLGRNLDGLAFHSFEIFKDCVTTPTNSMI
jgi:hypothetical protein